MSFLIPPVLAGIGISRASKSPKGSSTYRVFSPGQHGSAYQGLSDANPYANVTYRQSWIQKFLEGLGFRTSKDAYLESMALQAKEYDNQITQKEYNEKYESPIEQTQRLREAGINPDLSGDVSAGDAQAPVDDGNPPVAPFSDDLNVVQQFASGVLNGVQAAFGLAGQIQNIRSLKIGNESNLMNLVRSAWSMIIPDLYEQKNSMSEGHIDISNYYNSLKRQFGKSMSKRDFNSFYDRVNQFANTAEGWRMVYDTQTSKAKARKSMFREFAGESYSEWDDIMQGIGDELGNLAFRVSKKQLENKEIFEDNYDAQTASKLQSNPDDLQIRHNEREMSDYQNALRSSFKSIMSKLDALENKGNKVAPIVKAVLSTWLMGLMPSFR